MEKTPLWLKYGLSVEEAADYFNIGQNKLREMINSNINADWILWNNSKVIIKREKLAKELDRRNLI
jgi:hypothetical protein